MSDSPGKDLTAVVLKGYREMSGDKKIALAMELSGTVREVNQAGKSVGEVGDNGNTASKSS